MHLLPSQHLCTPVVGLVCVGIGYRDPAYLSQTVILISRNLVCRSRRLHELAKYSNRVAEIWLCNHKIYQAFDDLPIQSCITGFIVVYGQFQVTVKGCRDGVALSHPELKEHV